MRRRRVSTRQKCWSCVASCAVAFPHFPPAPERKLVAHERDASLRHTMREPNIVYFDLETQRTAGDVGGWGNKRAMGMSVGVTFSTAENRYRIYTERTVD